MPRTTLTGWMLSVVVALPTAAESADAPRTAIFRGTQSAATMAGPAQGAIAPVQGAAGQGPAMAPAGQPTPATPNVSQPQRDQALQRQREFLQQQAYANRPTEWQLQNPSGIQNRSPTSPNIDGYVAPNNYFGANQRVWTNLSGPVVQQQMPANISPTIPLTQTNVMIAPYTYYGASNAGWSNVTTGGATPSPLGGWNYRPGW